MNALSAAFEANVFGVVAVTYALLPLLKASPAGRIVNHSSVLDSLTLLSKNPKMFGGFVYKQIERSASCGFGGQVHFLPDAQLVSCTVVAVPSISCSLTCS